MPKGKAKQGKKKKDQVSYFQAITAYKISLKEKELDEIKREVEALSEKNDNLKQRKERLINSRSANLERALSDYRAYSNSVRAQKTCEKDEVVKEMKSLWQTKKTFDSELLTIRKEMRKTEKEIYGARKELKHWLDFKENGRNRTDMQKKLLQDEIAHMKDNFHVVTESLRKNMQFTINQINKSTNDVIEKKNRTAAEKVFRDMDKNAIQMSHDNDWMKRKIEMYKQDLAETRDYIASLEKQNIELMNYLFECGADELKLVKHAFHTQFLDDENLEENMILNVDLQDLHSVRPGSALDIAIKKLEELELRSERSENKKNEPLAITENAHDFKLGHYDFKTLSLIGYKKQLIGEPDVVKEEGEEEPRAKGSSGVQDWPITQEMLHDALKLEKSPRC